MIDKSTRKQLAERKERVRRRINTKVDPENYEFIPAKKPIDYYDNDIRQRVAVYARVSTDNVQQTSSYELQKKYYEDFVVHHPNWTLVKIYADEGISGTSLAHRDEFNSMIADCRSGKIDMIITKSVSRFARNVVDCISMVRMLAELPSPCLLYTSGHGELIQQIMNLIVRALELLTLIMLICAFWIENILFVTIQQLR